MVWGWSKEVSWLLREWCLWSKKIACCFTVSDPKNLLFPWHNWCDWALKTMSFMIICFFLILPMTMQVITETSWKLVAPWLPEKARKSRLDVLTRWQEKLPSWASVFSIPSPLQSSVFPCWWIVIWQQWAPKTLTLVALPLLYCSVLSPEILSQLTYLWA